MNRYSISTVVVLGAMILAWSCPAGAAETALPLATVGELIAYPRAAMMELPTAETLYVVGLPGVNRAVLIRPISREEYGSFQVQAIGHQIIERQMLVAAIVLPVMTESDVGAFSPELVRYLQGQINLISGFAVFPDAGP